VQTYDGVKANYRLEMPVYIPADVGNGWWVESGYPTVTMETGTQVLVTFSGSAIAGAGNKNALFGVRVSGATVAEASDGFAATVHMGDSGVYYGFSHSVVLDVVAGSNTFTMASKGLDGAWALTAGRACLTVQRLN
jgi:hypothetical protein